MNHIFSYLVSKSVRWYEKKATSRSRVTQGDPMAAVSSGQMWFPRPLSTLWCHQLHGLLENPPAIVRSFSQFFARTMLGAVYFQLLNHPYKSMGVSKNMGKPQVTMGFNTKMD